MNVSADLAVALIGYKDFIIDNYNNKWVPGTGGDADAARFAIEFEEGNKYIKVVSLSWGSRTVHSFIEKKTGAIWKAASWKAPAKNFARGNVFDSKGYLPRLSWTGIV